MKLPRPARAVVFDLDGTLIDSEALVREGYFFAARKLGVDMRAEHFLSLVGLHRDANDARLRALFGAEFPLERFHEHAHAHLEGRVAPLKPGAAELMDALDVRGLPFALATSSGRPWVDKHFTAHALADRFRAVVARGDWTYGKPHPEPYRLASAALGFAPAEVLALEDSPAGVASAHAAGCMTVMAPDLLAPDEDLRAKAIVVDTLHQVIALLDG